MSRKNRMVFIFAFMLLLLIFLQDKPSVNQAFAVSIPEASIVDDGQTAFITVMTYNIHRGIGEDGKLDLNRVYDTISASNAGIVALQEVERYSVRTGFQDQIEYLANKLSMYYVYGKSINILNGQYGNAVLSKYPIENYRFEQLPSIGENRTMLQADLNINGKRFVIYTTHLGLDRAERKAQFEKINELIQNTESPHMLTGDFNGTSEELSVLNSKYIDSAVQFKAQEVSTFKNDTKGSRIDYMLLSDKLKLLDYAVLQSDASDHFPVMSTIEVNTDL